MMTHTLALTCNYRQRRRQCGSQGVPLNKICPPPPQPELARHNKRFTTEEIIKTVATRCQILRLKCTKSFVGWGSALDPTGGAYSAPPDHLAAPPSWILGRLLLRGGKGQQGKGGDWRVRARRGREGRRGKRWREGWRGRGQGRPQAKAWPPELFSWRRRGLLGLV